MSRVGRQNEIGHSINHSGRHGRTEDDSADLYQSDKAECGFFYHRVKARVSTTTYVAVFGIYVSEISVIFLTVRANSQTCGPFVNCH